MANTEVDYVESAYATAIGVLFNQLFMGLSAQQKESELAAHFSTGFAAAKRAKELALGIAKPAAVATPAASINRGRRRGPART
ncbi:MAG: hypothetical protein V7632_2219 [Bradyrhizobium sp.]|jgi:hypothetical protein